MLYEIVYHSQSSAALKESDLLQILDSARRYNAENQISGCLLYYQYEFLQILEGEYEQVKKLYERICKDTRHHQIELIHEGPIEYRLYPYWTMAFQDIGKVEANKEALISVSEFLQISNLGRNQSKSKEIFWEISQKMLKKKGRNNSRLTLEK